MSAEHLLTVLNESELGLKELQELNTIYRNGIDIGKLLPGVLKTLETSTARIETLARRTKKTTEASQGVGSIPAHIKEFETLVHKHSAAEFALLYSLGLVQLWTALEATMHDFCLEALLFEDRWFKSEKAKQIKVKLADVISLDRRALCRQLLERLLTDIGSREERGVSRFEFLVAELGFGGVVAPEIRKQLLWLGEARNLLVHRRGVVDERFAEIINWSPFKLGEKLNVRARDFNLSITAVRAYFSTLKLRLEEAAVIAPSPVRQPFIAECIEFLRKP